MKQLFAIPIFLFGLIAVAVAQTISDVELRAAYCLGVTTEHEKLTRKEAVEAADSSGRKLYEIATALVVERRKRFRDYLTAKGFLFGRGVSAIKLAITRGSTDVKSCEDELKLAFYRTCPNQCKRHPSAERQTACTAACPSPDPCQRVEKCLENFLPF